MFDWWPSGFAPLQWNFSFGFPALATVWIAWLTLKVLRATKNIQENQISLLKAQNESIQQQTIASQALATLAENKQKFETIGMQLDLIKHLTIILGFCCDPMNVLDQNDSFEFIENNYPIYKECFEVKDRDTIKKIRTLYAECMTAKEKLYRNPNFDMALRTIDSTKFRANKMVQDLFDIYTRIKN